jgi:hypothetical protein
MQQIADWLKELGMPEYAERFLDNDIDTSVLRELTDQDLKDIGVSPGHRRKILRAIRDLSAVPVSVTAPKRRPAPGRYSGRIESPLSVITITGSGDHDGPEQMITITGMRTSYAFCLLIS